MSMDCDDCGVVGGEREKSLQRAAHLKESIQDYLDYSVNIPTGHKDWNRITYNQEKLRAAFKVSKEEWYNWEWQIENRVTDSSIFKELFAFTPDQIKEIEATGEKYRWAVSPYYLSLIDPNNPHDPVRAQSIPLIEEYNDSYGNLDPMDEENTSPAPAVTRRYPDRLIINVSNKCAMYCRHCQRRRNIGETDMDTDEKDIGVALDYVRENPEIRDVLLTGGDSFMLSNEKIDWLLTELEKIPHVEIMRFGTRTPVTLPYRINDELCEILSRHLPVYVNTQFNHPLEITPDSAEACLKLARSGVALGNQAVLLKGINNDAFIMRKLNQELLKIMVRPYYIFHAKEVRGTSHFRTRVEEGIEIMDKLRGFTSGLAVPAFIVNSPGGYGKTPLLPNYVVNFFDEKILLRTWENRIM